MEAEFYGVMNGNFLNDVYNDSYLYNTNNQVYSDKYIKVRTNNNDVVFSLDNISFEGNGSDIGKNMDLHL